MIYLFSGANGAGKTLYSIEFIETQLQPTDKDAPKRPVYYFSPDVQPLNINHDLLPHWHKLTQSEAQNWASLPQGSIIFLDEFRHVFPFRNVRDKIPHYVDSLSEHRSHGFDFVLTCQKPTAQFDPAVQGFISEHCHLVRLSGSNRFRLYRYGVFASDPLSPKLERPAIEVKRFNRKYFDYYRSAAVHTAKDRLPYLKLLIIPALIFTLLFLLYFAYSKTRSFADLDAVQSQTANNFQTSKTSGFLSSLDSPVLSPDTPTLSLDDFQPIIPEMPYTAPYYSELAKPSTFPRVAACVYHHKRNSCNCYTQQATPLDVPYSYCRHFVLKGEFNPFLPERPEYPPIPYDW